MITRLFRRSRRSNVTALLLTDAKLRADAWRHYAQTRNEELRGALVCLDLATHRWVVVSAERDELSRRCQGLAEQNAQLTAAFEAIFPAANGALREHIEWARCLGAMAPETFIPTQRTGEISE